MCGIVGYTGTQEAASLLLDGLQRLEYRGYDSSGIASVADAKIRIIKKMGRLKKLHHEVNSQSVPGRCGIGHNRWATHGRPSDANAHPHTDCDQQFAVVHNGIIENYQELKEWLQERNHKFTSETDTEVIPHLIEEYYEGDLLKAVQAAVNRLKGSYAIAILSSQHPEQLVAARHDNPLIIGLGENENFITSDVPAVLEHTRTIHVLEEDELALVTPQQVKIYDREGNPVALRHLEVNWDPDMAQKHGYPDFMLKEIHEQPQAIRETLRGRIDPQTGEPQLSEFSLSKEELTSLRRVVVIAAGTAFHAGLIAKYLIESLARIPVRAEVASELRYSELFIDQNTLALVISQSGETADTLSALREARRLGAHVTAITNVVGSTVSREADDVIYTWAGPEVAVASTKAYTSQLVILYLLAMHLGLTLERLDTQFARQLGLDMLNLSERIDTAIRDNEGWIKEYAPGWVDKESAFFIGRGIDSYLAMEGQLKVKEISYIHAEAVPAGELKHGTLALITDGVPVVALATQARLYDKMNSNIREATARGGKVLAVTSRDNARVEEGAESVIWLPEVAELLRPVVAAVPLQLLAYYVAKARGCDVDKPRNLAKSVTVE